MGTVHSELIACVEAATAAPSVHNSQPWRFRLRHDRVDVFCDRTRRLEVIDPHGRELLISVGAAILNLRLAMLVHGRTPVLRLLPDPTDPDLLARVSAGPPVAADGTVRALAEAIPRRHTNRRPFTAAAIPASVIEELAGAAAAEGARLAVADPVGRDAILGLVRTANEWWRTRTDYRAELTEWTLPYRGRRDGVPAQNFGPWDALERLPLRDFGLTRPDAPRRDATFEAHPRLVVLSTYGDGPVQWLRAGQALERVLLTATVRGLATTPMTAPLEIPELRELLTDTRTGKWAQVILRIGYGPATVASPRRPVSEVLLREEGPGRTGPLDLSGDAAVPEARSATPAGTPERAS